VRTLGTLTLLIAALSTGCEGGGSPISGLDASVETGCTAFLDYDAGAIGSAGQVVTVATAAADAWKPGLVMTGLQGKISPDGTDVDGGWTFTFGSPTITGLATVEPRATDTLVAGDCAFQSNEPSIRDFRIDSPLALAIAVDAGCVLGSTVPVQLMGASNSASPLFDIDPAWLISASSVDGGPRSCVVDADTGAFGIPTDGGVPGGGDAG
jgi:hypothetical protein